MNRFDDCSAAFLHAISRARDMVKLFDALTIIGPRPSNDDALRAAYFQSVSSFDFFIHEVVAVESDTSKYWFDGGFWQGAVGV